MLKSKKDIKELIYNFSSRFGIGVFRRIFPEYFAKEPLKPTDRYIEYPFVIRNLPKPPAKVLDVGCSGSFFPLLLAGFGYEVCGVDVREYAIINKIEFNDFKFLKVDIRGNYFNDNYFDAVTAISTVEHIGLFGRYGMDEDLGGDKKAVAEMKRIVKQNGVILLTFPFGKAKILKPYTRVYDSNLVKLLTDGLEIEKEEYYMQNNEDDWYPCPRNKVEAVDANNERYPLCLIKLRKK